MRKRKLTVHEEWLVEIEKMPSEKKAAAYRDLLSWMVGDEPSDLIKDVVRKNRKGNPNFVKGSSNPYFARVGKNESETRAVAPMGKGAGIRNTVPRVTPIAVQVKSGEIAAIERTTVPTPSDSAQEGIVSADEAVVVKETVKESESKKPNGIDVYDYIRKAGISSFHPAPFLEYCERRGWKWKDGTPLDWHEAARIWSEWDKNQSYKMRYNLAE